MSDFKFEIVDRSEIDIDHVMSIADKLKAEIESTAIELIKDALAGVHIGVTCDGISIYSEYSNDWLVNKISWKDVLLIAKDGVENQKSEDVIDAIELIVSKMDD